MSVVFVFRTATTHSHLAQRCSSWRTWASTSPGTGCTSTWRRPRTAYVHTRARTHTHAHIRTHTRTHANTHIHTTHKYTTYVRFLSRNSVVAKAHAHVYLLTQTRAPPYKYTVYSHAHTHHQEIIRTFTHPCALRMNINSHAYTRGCIYIMCIM